MKIVLSHQEILLAISYYINNNTEYDTEEKDVTLNVKINVMNAGPPDVEASIEVK